MERFIKFAPELLKSLFDGSKTQTRRVVKIATRPSCGDHFRCIQNGIQAKFVVKDVKQGPLGDIKPEDALAEGVKMCGNSSDAPFNAISDFARLWDSLADDGEKWANNPWVWIITFERM